MTGTTNKANCPECEAGMNPCDFHTCKVCGNDNSDSETDICESCQEE